MPWRNPNVRAVASTPTWKVVLAAASPTAIAARSSVPGAAPDDRREGGAGGGNPPHADARRTRIVSEPSRSPGLDGTPGNPSKELAVNASKSLRLLPAATVLAGGAAVMRGTAGAASS